MRRFLVAGNWKMNTTLLSGRELATAIGEGLGGRSEAADILVCPPFPYLAPVAEVVSSGRMQLGAQDVYFESSGAFTGEVATEMLRDVGCTHVILGHSERRHVLGESDAVINRKVKASLADGLTVLLCVGELLSEREAGDTDAVVARQLEGGLFDIDSGQLTNIVIAYEPVWAIGTGVTATPEQAEEAHAKIRSWLVNRYDGDVADRVQILYGGSVKPDNAFELFSNPNVDGGLIGGASLKSDSFLAIYDAACKVAGA